MDILAPRPSPAHSSRSLLIEIFYIKNLLSLFLFTSLLFTACSGNRSEDAESQGNTSEILIVCNNTEWKGAIGDSIRAMFSNPMEGLPDSEAEFTLINIPEVDFTNLLQLQRNILLVERIAGKGKSKVETLTDVWSHPQRVIKIKASSDTAFISLFAKHGAAIRELFNQSERARFDVSSSTNRNSDIERKLSQEFGVKMKISKDFKLVKNTCVFLWMQSNSAAGNLNLLIYTLPFRNLEQLTPDSIAAFRNRKIQQFINFTPENSNLKVDPEVFIPVSRQILFKDLCARETRGFAVRNGDSLSQPFINYTIVDAPRQRTVVFDGSVNFIINPKRDGIRQLDSMIWEAEFCKLSKKE
ncbi:MAG: DUF4837 family protein [Bacteroidota bacterium]